MADSSNRVVVVGLGYVGLPLAIRAVEVGHEVIGFDLSIDRVQRLQAAETYVDDISHEQLAHAIGTGRFTATSSLDDCKGFDVAVLAVPTPLRHGSPDLGYVEAAGRDIASILEQGACVILESTTYPGTTEGVFQQTLEHGSGLTAGRDFALGFSPERIDPGNREWTFTRTPKIVSGIDDRSLDRITAFYETLVDTVVRVSGTKEAELAKLLENTFRHVNIALLNELAVFSHGLGIDIWEVIDAASTKPFGFMPFRPGAGVGGHCLPIDPSYLSWQVRQQLGMSFRFVELANDINEHMPDYVAQRVTRSLNSRQLAVNGAKVLLLGIAYKRNSGDARESPGVRVATILDNLNADLRWADPLIEEPPRSLPGERVDATSEELEAADLVVVLADHDVFDWSDVLLRSVSIFDACHRLEGANVEHI